MDKEMPSGIEWEIWAEKHPFTYEMIYGSKTMDVKLEYAENRFC